jgi:hypothetical protein
MGVRTRGLDIKAGAQRNAADKAARAEAKAVVDRWNEQLALGRGMLGGRRSGRRCSPARHGSTCSAPAAGRAAPSIFGLSTVTRSHPSGPWCSACAAPGVKGQRRCRSCWGWLRCRLLAAPQTAKVRDLLGARLERKVMPEARQRERPR